MLDVVALSREREQTPSDDDVDKDETKKLPQIIRGTTTELLGEASQDSVWG